MFALPSPGYEDLPGFRSAFERADAAKRLEAFETFIKPFHARLAKLIVEPAPDFEHALELVTRRSPRSSGTDSRLSRPTWH